MNMVSSLHISYSFKSAELGVFTDQRYDCDRDDSARISDLGTLYHEHLMFIVVSSITHPACPIINCLVLITYPLLPILRHPSSFTPSP